MLEDFNQGIQHQIGTVLTPDAGRIGGVTMVARTTDGKRQPESGSNGAGRPFPAGSGPILSGRDETLWVTSPYQDEWLKKDGVLKRPLRSRRELSSRKRVNWMKRSSRGSHCGVKTQPQARNEPPHQSPKLSQAGHLGDRCPAGLPSLGQPTAEDLGSRIEAVELLVLQQNNDGGVLKIISSTGVAGFADFPDLDYAPALGGVAKEHLGANPFAVEAIWSSCAAPAFSARTAPRWTMPFGTSLAGNRQARLRTARRPRPRPDRIYYYGKPPKAQLENEEAWRALGRTPGPATRCGREGRSLVGVRTIWRPESLGGHGR